MSDSVKKYYENKKEEEMSKMKELNNIADCVVDVMSEHLDHNIAWAVQDTIVDGLSGDDFINAIHHIRKAVVYKLNTKYS